MTERRVALVKSAGRADAFAVALRAAGFVPVLVSPFQREPIPQGEQELARALAYALGLAVAPRRASVWVAVTSAHAVPALEAVRHLLPAARLAAVGAGTATALHAAGLRAHVVGDAGGAGLAERMLDAGLGRGDVVLHPCAMEARVELRATLADAGVTLRALPVYRMTADPVGERAAEGEFHAVVVTSPRLAERALELFPAKPRVVAIGRTTAAALRDLGWTPAVVAATPSPADVAAAVGALA
mgnify:CR=1 FL=1